mmetsp:Transcript_4568/g.11175  ORF Transcript_4568/g.11175 Transcript_4568/m.11175 type:complete len:200 (+) Transcript_4568:45-644(+)
MKEAQLHDHSRPPAHFCHVQDRIDSIDDSIDVVTRASTICNCHDFVCTVLLATTSTSRRHTRYQSTLHHLHQKWRGPSSWRCWPHRKMQSLCLTSRQMSGHLPGKHKDEPGPRCRWQQRGCLLSCGQFICFICALYDIADKARIEIDVGPSPWSPLRRCFAVLGEMTLMVLSKKLICIIKQKSWPDAEGRGEGDSFFAR